MSDYTLCIIQPLDPRGKKIGGIESHIRELIRSAPADFSVLLIGIDEIGDLAIGREQEVGYEGRKFRFLPLLARTDDSHLVAAKRLRDSLTLNFFLAFFRHYVAVRRAVRRQPCSVEIQRFEYATFGRLLGLPSLQIVHGEGRADQPMDSLLKRYWMVNQWNEAMALRVANRVVGVNPRIIERIREKFPYAAGKSQMLTVSVNTDIFALAASFPPIEPFKIGFAGRLDAFKRPDLIFRIIHDLRTRLGVDAQFHYIGGGDPSRFPEFEAIREASVLHGTQKAAGVAELLGGLHTGILVSEFEGMPVFVLELLAVGRPLTALQLPQLDLVVEPDVSGLIVPRAPDEAANVTAVADALLRLRDLIASGGVSPAAIRAKVDNFSHRTQMQRHFEIHRALQREKWRPGDRTARAVA